MNKVTLVLPYFGEKFPNFFSILLNSMYYNNKVNFLIFTNIDVSKLDMKKSNVRFIHMTLEEVKARATEVLGYPAKLEVPYKLCDYKPFYGLIFSDYLKGADWWGYFDSDIIFGNINEFINNPIFNKYDRIFTHGHLTFYRNTKKVNTLCITDFNNKSFANYKNVTTSNLIYGFDEWGDPLHGKGLSAIIDQTKCVSQYDNISLFADIFVENYNFITTSQILIKYFEYKNGNLIGIDEKNQKHRFLYAHFQKRNMINNIDHMDSTIYIFPNYLTNNLNEHLPDEYSRWKKLDTKRRVKRFIKNLSIENLSLKIHNKFLR